MARGKKNQKPVSLLDDPTTRLNLLTAIEAGATVRDACAYAGVSDDTLRRYVEANAEFALSYKKARANAKIACVGVIRKAAQSNWQAAAWFLERSDPENWGRTTKHILDVEPGLLKRLQQSAQDSGVDLAEVFEAMINEFAVIAEDSEEQP